MSSFSVAFRPRPEDDIMVLDLAGELDAHTAPEFESALEVLKEGARLEPKDGRIENNIKAAYDRWANGFMEKKDWAAAITVYEKGLLQLPGDSHMKHNLEYCKQEMAGK